ncbi:MAG: hypothetical protein HQL38_17920 [Alphaproteobacteria bacterium]|nr:hypothetical protein [Alphaproteobacteria bacterium]
MRNAIFVPTVHVDNDTFLASQYLLWDQLYRIRPDTVSERQSDFEVGVAGHGFLRDADFHRFRDDAFAMYEGIVEAMLGGPLRDDPRIEALRRQWLGPTQVYVEKLTPELVELWRRFRIGANLRSRINIEVPAFWADLWVCVLALTMGRADGIQPIANDPLSHELIRLCLRFGPDGTPLEQPTRPEADAAVIFLNLGLPMPGIAADPDALTDLDRLPDLRLRCLEERERYHELVRGYLDQVPFHLEAGLPIDALLRDLRSGLEHRFRNDWAKRVTGAGHRFLPWAGAALLQWASTPDQLPALLTATAGIGFTVAGYAFSRRENPWALGSPFLLECRVQEAVYPQVGRGKRG